MSVHLRWRKYNDGSEVPYLDIYTKGHRVREVMTNLRKYPPKNARDRAQNKSLEQTADNILAQRKLELQYSHNGMSDPKERSKLFLLYFKQYTDSYDKRDKRVVLASYKQYCLFSESKGLKNISISRMDRMVATQFKDFLLKRFNGETPANYFKKFKQVLESLVYQEIINVNPAAKITVARRNTIAKEILSFEEILAIRQTPCKHNEIKDAFIFSCYTGLRFCDVANLTFDNVFNNVITVTQKKTNNVVEIPLHESIAGRFNKEGLEGKVFKLPSYNTCRKRLIQLVNDAGINKHITWHCARHSFGTLIVHKTSDVYTTGRLLGHSSLKYTVLYLRENQKKNTEAINLLPNLE